MSRAQITWSFAIAYSVVCHFVVVMLATFLAQNDGYLFITLYLLLSAAWLLHHIETTPRLSFSRGIVVFFFSLGMGLMMVVPSFICFFFLSIAYILASFHSFSIKGGVFQKTITPLVRD